MEEGVNNSRLMKIKNEKIINPTIINNDEIPPLETQENIDTMEALGIAEEFIRDDDDNNNNYNFKNQKINKKRKLSEMIDKTVLHSNVDIDGDDINNFKDLKILYESILKLHPEYKFVEDMEFKTKTMHSDKFVIQSLKKRLRMCNQKYIPPIGSLTINQYKALIGIIKGCNLFITGVAGSGKSHFLKYAYSILMSKFGQEVVITASSGTAVTNLEIPFAKTLHSFIGRDRFEGDIDLEAIEVMKNKSLWMKHKTTSILFIDEISLIDSKLIQKFSDLMKLVRKCELPFGGIQVVCFGDFMQLPPVRINEEIDINGFAFASQVWKEGITNTVYFTDNLRQKDSPELFNILQEIRYNCISDESFEKLTKRVEGVDGFTKKDSPIEPICIFPKKYMVEKENIALLNKLKEEGKEIYTFERRIKAIGLKENEKKYFYQRALQSLPVVENLQLCTGLPVILTTNYNEILKNGTQGTIIDWKKIVSKKNAKQFIYPLVEFIVPGIGKYVSVIKNWIWDVPKNPMIPFRKIMNKNPDDFPYSGIIMSNIPLAPGKAITIHRSQCKTFCAVLLNLSEVFTPNMGYVALSRVRTMEGLYLDNISMASLYVFEEIVELYRTLDEKTKNENEKLLELLKGTIYHEKIKKSMESNNLYYLSKQKTGKNFINEL